jgi:murein DD-endopeptidase MepM/ murein hydrolase activator NlpD
MIEKDLDILKKLITPTENKITDKFGLDRDWGSNGWTPKCGYSPMHMGVDFSARPVANIQMPINGKVWGEFRAFPVGSYCLLLPEGTENISLIFFHCDPTNPRWVEYKQGDNITKQAGHGIGAPHLHYEVMITEELGKYLLSSEILSPLPNLKEVVYKKAEQANINKQEAMAECLKQTYDFGINEVGYNYFIQKDIPSYKKSKFSNVGKGNTFIIDWISIQNWQKLEQRNIKETGNKIV